MNITVTVTYAHNSKGPNLNQTNFSRLRGLAQDTLDKVIVANHVLWRLRRARQKGRKLGTT